MMHIEKQRTSKQLYNMRPNERMQQANDWQSKNRSRSKSASRIFKYKQQQLKSKVRQKQGTSNNVYSSNYRNSQFSPVIDAKSTHSDNNPKSRISFISGNSNITYADRLKLPNIQVPVLTSRVTIPSLPSQNVIINGKQIRHSSIQKVPISFHYKTPTQNFHPQMSTIHPNSQQVRFKTEPQQNITALSPPKLIQGKQKAVPFQIVNNIPKQIRSSITQKVNGRVNQNYPTTQQINRKNINEIQSKAFPNAYNSIFKQQPINEIQNIYLKQEAKKNQNISSNSNMNINMKHQVPQYVSYRAPQQLQNSVHSNAMIAKINGQSYRNPEHQNITNYVTIHEPVILKQVHEIHHIHDTVPLPVPASQTNPGWAQIENGRQASYFQSKPLISSQSILQPLKQDFTRYMNTTAGRQSQFNDYNYNYNEYKDREQAKNVTAMANSNLSIKPNNDGVFQDIRNSKSRVSVLDTPIQLETKKSQIRVQQQIFNTSNRYFDSSVKLPPIRRLDTLAANVKKLTTKNLQQQPKYETWSMNTPYSDYEQKDSPLLIKKQKTSAFPSPPPVNVNDKDLEEINQLSISQISPVYQKTQSQNGFEASQPIPAFVKPIETGNGRPWAYLDMFVIFLLIGIGLTLIFLQIFR